MILQANESWLKGVFSLHLHKFEDHRGYYIELYNKKQYGEMGFPMDFVQDDISVSRRNVLRGIHGDDVTWKLISCLQGSFYLVVVNCDKDSPDFGKWVHFDMNDWCGLQVLIPPKFGNAHLVTSSFAVFYYKQSEYYSRDRQFTYRYDDFNIKWPIAASELILSERDKGEDSINR